MISPLRLATSLLCLCVLSTSISAAPDQNHLISSVARIKNLGVSGSISPKATTTTEKNGTVGAIPRPNGAWVSPEYTWFFEYPLPVASVKHPKSTWYADLYGRSAIDYYEVEIKNLTRQIYPDRAATALIGYDGMDPGPKFVMRQGREAVVRFTNNGPVDISVHVHGQYNRAPFDGWASDYAHSKQYKDYYYPNSQNARTIWYHDHTEFTTGEHTYRGLNGFYLITDAEEQSLGLPKGDHDLTLALSAKFYNDDGSLRYDTNNSIGLWGDVIQVNGQPWPHHKVEPRKYRLRFLDGAVSRTFKLSLAIDSEFGVGTKPDLHFNVIASDGGLFSRPVKTDYLAISMGERYETIVDFSGCAGKNITLRNERGMGENIDYAATDMVMRFIVGDTVTNDTNNGDVPQNLRHIPPFPAKDVPDRQFTFERTADKWEINGVGWADIEHRILARPKRGDDEIWTLTNGAGNGTHPIHIHLVDFKVLSRTGGRNEVYPYEGAGLKDVVWLAGGETIKVGARYAPWDGVYMFHCHNLVHEDHDMLVAFNITQLANWGYDNSTLFIDPMQPEFRPKDYNEADYTDEAIDKKLAWFYSTNAYNHGDVKAVYSCLDAYASGVNCTQTSTRSTSTRRTPTRSTSIRSTLAPSTFRTVTGLTTVITPTLSSFSGNAMLRSSSSAWNTYGAKSGYGPVTGS